MLRVITAGLPEENNEKLAENVERRESSRARNHPAKEWDFHDSPFDNEIFAVVSACERTPRKGQHTEKKAEHREGKLLAKSTHVPHLHLVMHRNHHRTR